MTGATTREFDVADHLGSPEEIAAYLDAVLEDGDDKLLLVTLRHVAKSRGFAKVAQGAGLRRETLYQSFSADGNSLAEEFLPKNTLPKIFLSFIAVNGQNYWTRPNTRYASAAMTSRNKHGPV